MTNTVASEVTTLAAAVTEAQAAIMVNYVPGAFVVPCLPSDRDGRSRVQPVSVVILPAPSAAFAGSDFYPAPVWVASRLVAAFEAQGRSARCHGGGVLVVL